MKDINWNDYLNYDEESPTYLTWKVEIRGGEGDKIACTTIGDVAGMLTDRYAKVGLLGKPYLIHRVVYEMFNSSIPKGMQIDHINGNKLDNRITNLRCVSTSANLQNRSMTSNNTSGITGVSIFKSGNAYCWRSCCYSKGKSIFRSFSIHKYGFEEAKKLAIEARVRTISLLNSEGADYTDRHGI